MDSLEHLRKQIHGLEDLRAIVKTMKALSGANIRQFERAVTALADYHRTVELGLHVVLRQIQIPQLSLLHSRKSPRIAAIVFGSDHGLCGRFNETVIAHALNRLAVHKIDQGNRVVLAVGTRAAAGLAQTDVDTDNVLLAPGSVSQIGAKVQQILFQIDAWRSESDINQVYLYYNRNMSRSSYKSTEFRLLPVNLRRFKQLEAQRWPSRRLPTFSMDPETLFTKLLRQYFFVTLFRACAESQASEHASRVRAMQSAQQNLEDGIEDVTRALRSARQGAITSELLDIVVGFEALTANNGRPNTGIE